MTHILELSDGEFKIPLINVLKDLLEKIDNIQDNIGNFSSRMQSIRQNTM